MRTHTESYKNLKKELDDLWNFAVMISYAVPSLKKTIKGIEDEIPKYKMPFPDYFNYDDSSNDDLKEYVKTYKPRLATYLWISIFSFFEAYVNSVLKELVVFHGGETEFIELSDTSTKKRMGKISDEMFNLALKGKLHLNYNPSLNQKNVRYTNKLTDLNYIFPSELFSTLGIKSFIKKIKYLEAKDIPLIMKDLNFNLDDVAEHNFIRYKDNRNRIAHGDSPELSLKDVKEMYRCLRKLAYLFDIHLLKYYFINERFRNYCI